MARKLLTGWGEGYPSRKLVGTSQRSLDRRDKGVNVISFLGVTEGKGRREQGYEKEKIRKKGLTCHGVNKGSRHCLRRDFDKRFFDDK